MDMGISDVTTANALRTRLLAMAGRIESDLLQITRGGTMWIGGAS